jgi:hypothetical protein
MRTDDLAAMLARGAAAERVTHPARIWAAATVAGAGVAVIILLLTIGAQPGLPSMLGMWGWWLKAGFAFATAAAGLLAAGRLGRPGAARRGLLGVVAAPLLVLWALGLTQLLLAPPAERAALVMGRTWASCPALVALLSVPMLACAMLVLRGLAPTCPRSAGAAAGLFAGGTGALVYTLHCPELAPAFIGVWYVLGIAIPTACGALLGPRLLRW